MSAQSWVKCVYCGGKAIEDTDGDYWCGNCHRSIDVADVELRAFERDHYIWFDDEDTPHLGVGWAGFYSNAVQLDSCH